MKWRVYEDATTNKFVTFTDENKAYLYYNDFKTLNPGADVYIEEPLRITFLRDVSLLTKRILRRLLNRAPK